MSASGFRSLPVEQWPMQDRQAWDEAQQPYDPLSRSCTGNALVARWGPTTLRGIAFGYGFWLDWLKRVDIEAILLDAAGRATLERAMAYRDAMVAAGLADNTRAGRLQALGNALRIIAPDKDWIWMLRAAGRLRNQAVAVRDTTSRLQSPIDVIRLGEDMMLEAEHGRFRTDVERAVLFRDGLVLVFLTQRPLRRHNLTSLTLGTSLCRSGSGWRVEVAPENTKTRVRIEADWPRRHLPHLETYLARFRPILLQCATAPAPTDGLWISKQGCPMCAGGLEVAIKARTEDHFGIAINPHAFRDIAATAIASFAPEEATVIMAILSHKSMRTSERHYNRARQLAATSSYQATLEVFRRNSR